MRYMERFDPLVVGVSCRGLIISSAGTATVDLSGCSSSLIGRVTTMAYSTVAIITVSLIRKGLRERLVWILIGR